MDIIDPEKLAEEGKKAYQRGKYSEASEKFQLAATGYQAQNNHLLVAEMKNNLSVALLQAGNAQAALEAVTGTEEVFKQAEDEVKQAMAIGNRAAALEVLKHLDEAEVAYQQSATLLKSNGETELYAHVMKSLSALQIRKGKQIEGIVNMKAGLEGIENPTLKQRILKKLLKLPFKFVGR
jgi:tetratricopeptide (TPR) repeat protein